MTTQTACSECGKDGYPMDPDYPTVCIYCLETYLTSEDDS